MDDQQQQQQQQGNGMNGMNMNVYLAQNGMMPSNGMMMHPAAQAAQPQQQVLQQQQQGISSGFAAAGGGGMPMMGAMAGMTGLTGQSVASANAIPAPKYKKAPDAPKRFKSAFIIFSAEKHKSIKVELAKEGRTKKTTDIANHVSEAWRKMPPDEKEHWEQAARKDKARYEVEKAMYKGPWKIPANKRTPKDPSAPKRPMSAFLAFSNKRRAALKRENPDATNADLSKMLSKTWKEAPDELRSKYMEEEAALRATYKVEMAKWRKKVAEEKKLERSQREAIAMKAAESRESDPAGMAQAIAAGQYGGRSDGDGGQIQQQQQQQQPQGGDNSNGNNAMTGNMGGMYGNPYGLQAGGAGGGGGQIGDFQQNFAAMQGGANPAQYAGLMAHPFAAQAQQQLLSQLFPNQFKNNAMQGNPLGMYQQGQAFGQGVQGLQQAQQGIQALQQQPQQQQQQQVGGSQQGANMGGQYGMANGIPQQHQNVGGAPGLSLFGDGGMVINGGDANNPGLLNGIGMGQQQQQQPDSGQQHGDGDNAAGNS